MTVEAVRDTTIPVELELRLTVGRAVEALSQLRAGEEVPEAIGVFRQTADCLSDILQSRSEPGDGQSLGQYADWLDLLRKVSPPNPAPDLKPVVEKLRTLVAAGRVGPAIFAQDGDGMRDLQVQLRAMRRALARTGAVATDQATSI